MEAHLHTAIIGQEIMDLILIAAKLIVYLKEFMMFKFLTIMDVQKPLPLMYMSLTLFYNILLQQHFLV